MQALELLPGWELCPFGHDAQDVIKSNPWGSHALLFASGSGCLTFACIGGYAGNCARNMCASLRCSLTRSVSLGDLVYANNGFVIAGAKYWSKSPQDDILLRRRAQSSGSPHVSAAAPASPPKATASSELPQALPTSPAPMSHQELAAAELIEDALRLHGPDQDLCVQYCAARAPKQTQSVAQPSSLTPMVQQKRDDLWQHLQKKGFRESHIDVAIERCNFDALSLRAAFTWCCEFIQRELDSPGKPPQPLSQAPLTTSWKTSSQREQIGAQGHVSDVTVKKRVRMFLKDSGYAAELIEAALMLHGPDADLCAQYCAARTPKQTQSVARSSSLTPMVQHKRDVLWQHLSKKGFREASIDVAIERCNIDVLTVSTAFTWCCEFIQRELDPPGKPPQPLSQAPLTTSWKTSSQGEQIGARAAVSEATVMSNLIRTFLKNMGYPVELIEEALKLHGPNTDLCAQYCEARAPKHVTIERCNIDALIDIRAQLKSMGYTDQQVDTAFARGCSDLDACVQYLLSAESSSKASSHAPAPAPGGGGAGATTSSKMVISCDGRQLVNVDCALLNPVPPSTVTLTRF